jgi:putative flippase GtrA
LVSEPSLSPLRGLVQNRFFRYLAVGGVNTVFGYGIFAALILLNVWYPLAALIATVLGVLFNFKTTGTLVFGSRDHSLLYRFLLVYGIGYVIGVLVLRLGKEFGVSVLVTSAVMTLPMAFFTYTLQRLLVFRNSR